MDEDLGHTGGLTRRSVLHRGGKLVYIAPVVLAAMKVESTFAASDGGIVEPKDKDKPKPKPKN